MHYRPLYRVLDPESHDPAARMFRVVHHATGRRSGSLSCSRRRWSRCKRDYGAELAAGFYVVGAFFIAEYLLRLIAAPSKAR